MRVLYVTGHYPPDFVSGATLQVQRLAEAVQRLGHEVAVLSGAIPDPALGDGAVRRDVVNGVAVHWIGTAQRVEQDVAGLALEGRRRPVRMRTVAAAREAAAVVRQITSPQPAAPRWPRVPPPTAMRSPASSRASSLNGAASR